MQSAYIGEIFMFGSPRGFAMDSFVKCEGQAAAAQGSAFQALARSTGQSRLPDLRQLDMKGLSPGGFHVVTEGIYPSK